MQANEIIKYFQLKKHPEGGFSSVLYEDSDFISEECLPDMYSKKRPYWNAIYYLLTANCPCVFHRIQMSELWNFYLGEPLELFNISPDGVFEKCILGHDILNGQKLAYVFPKNHWIGAKTVQNSSFALVSCVTAPGFTFSDWELGEKQSLCDKFPHLRKFLESF